MSYLKFDKNLLINLEQSLRLEVLRTNQSGAYHCTTIVGANTRKQHGLLVIPVPEIDDNSHVLLSSLDETVIQHGAPFNLGLHRYSGGVYSPNGHKYIREYDCERVPTHTFRVGGVILKREKIFITNENRILIRYTLVDAHSKTTLQFRPFLAFRNANDLCVENQVASRDYKEVSNGISTCMYDGYPELFMQVNHKPKFVFDPHWYKGIEYIKDLERGIPYTEDLYVPGYFEVDMKKGDTIIFSAGVSEVNTRQLTKMYEDEIKTRTPRTSFYNCLKNSAKQFYMTNADGHYLFAGYPWFKVRARDEFIALPGCTLSNHHRPDFEAIMDTAKEAFTRWMETGEPDKHLQGIDLPDVPLWAAWAIQRYSHDTDVPTARERYGELVAQLIDFIIDGKHPNLQVDDNGLVRTDGTRQPMSWMDSARPDGTPLIPRTGYLVEFNALWYNALMFLLQMYADDKQMQSRVERWQKISDAYAESFAPTFLNDYGYLYDYVNGSYTDLSVRPNMVIAVGVDHTPLDRRQRKRILDFITRELLTPKGLRTLSPNSYGYNPWYVGNPEQREKAYYSGSARPWLMGFYCHAYVKVFGIGGLSFVNRMMIGFEDEMSQGAIGTLSELYDGNPPFIGRGAVSFAANVGEILRVLRLLKNLDV
ncbi:MAG: glycogen debranching enzyme N-terminal domain-containing protein [Sodaliphilus sp.]|jgi:predicted glycogen debranching enzyme|nr:amylo-alpha-1,6-glucosidase [Bacteroidales bacterium]MDY2593236.1 glycogen debranching enzyme N-terminal domain-containing protein [Sodaliphilus sp.]HAO63486.1 4-alpha-glucanotransferase [Porphyromonadaceae bacterium]MCI6224047.1 amylo-alpha-1,6-glucosidase [Bacteroidales bacterium]MCI6292725.1 amylo-alpha-1,6-glucosidase [Bacteroidales bacterium]